MGVCALLWRAQTERNTIYHYSLFTPCQHSINSRLIPIGVLFHSKPRLNPPARLTPSPPLSHEMAPSTCFRLLCSSPTTASFSQGVFTAPSATFEGCIGEIEDRKISPAAEGCIDRRCADVITGGNFLSISGADDLLNSVRCRKIFGGRSSRTAATTINREV